MSRIFRLGFLRKSNDSPTYSSSIDLCSTLLPRRLSTHFLSSKARNQTKPELDMNRKIAKPKENLDEGFVNGGEPETASTDWEVRPGGMLVQCRISEAVNRTLDPIIRVHVKFGSLYYEINTNSRATFGELKTKLAEVTGLHRQDQKLLFKNKEKNSGDYLDTSGVKNRSKMLLIEDPFSQEKRFLENRKNAKMEKASKTVSEISLEVDKLGGQVSDLESNFFKYGTVAGTDIVGLTELLMNELVKLDGIVVDGDVKLQKKIQVKRLQKYVETLDALKNKSRNNEDQNPGNQHRYEQSQAAIITTKWETFDSTPPLLTYSSKFDSQFFK